MIQIFINNFAVFVPINTTLLEACEFTGVEIPRFCFHERLSIAGNCRICLIEIEKTPKPVVSCVIPVTKHLNVLTHSPLVKRAREAVLELLLINHPLDCPVCDQGGECDLQDQAMFFGSNKTRFFENKRGVNNKNFGLFIKTIMTRCIHCTRCVRFFATYTCFDDLGLTNRSSFSEVGTFINKFSHSELSANIIDLCPVGALTSKSYAFIGRVWEFRSIETTDFNDAVGAYIKIDFKESTIIRILPKEKNSLNMGWITDKCRFNFDAFWRFRIGSTYVKKKKVLFPSAWEECSKNVTFLVAFCDLSVLCSVYSDLESLFQAKKLSDQQGFKNVGYVRKFFLNVDFCENFLCNTPLIEIEHSDFCLFIGINPRLEASSLNNALLRRFRSGLPNSFSLGGHHLNSFKKNVLGTSPKILFFISEGSHFLCVKLKKSTAPLLFYGGSLAERKDFQGLQKMLQRILPFSEGICFINQEQNQVGAFFFGMQSVDFSFRLQFRLSQLFYQLHSQNKLVNDKSCFIIGSFRNLEETLFERKIPFDNSRVFFIIIGDDTIIRADILLPTKSFFEKEGTSLNLEGRLLKTATSFLKPVEISRRESIFFKLFRKNCYTTSEVVRNWVNLKKIEESFLIEKHFFSNELWNKGQKLFFSIKPAGIFHTYTISYLPFKSYLTDYFGSDPFSKNSVQMIKCSDTQRKLFRNFF
jgi:NADH-quinone oxidoreductase chain G